jgi:glycerol-3-phosphate dehydrogenase
MLRSDSLVGAMVYYDGAHNDSRTNIALALTAAAYGATVANHVEVSYPICTLGLSFHKHAC